MKKVNLLSKAEMKKVLGGYESIGRCDSDCLAVGSECGTAELKGKCTWVPDSTCPGGGWSGCFFPLTNS